MFLEKCSYQLAKKNGKDLFDSIMMLRFGKTKVAKKYFMMQETSKYLGQYKCVKIISARTDSNNLIGYLDKVLRPSDLVFLKTNWYIKTFKFKDGDKDKNKKLTSLRIDDRNLWEKYKTISIKAEDLKNIELNTVSVYDDRYKENKLRTYGDKVYANFHDWNVPEDDMECKDFIIVPIDCLSVYKN